MFSIVQFDKIMLFLCATFNILLFFTHNERKNFMSIRTDLAVESAQQVLTAAPISGVVQIQHYYDNADIKVTEITVDNQKAADIIGQAYRKIYYH